jgi:putative FmdB family regulatory protein
MIYDYMCEQCEHTYELWAKVDDRNEPDLCPKCGARAHRIISGNQTGFQLKGDKWMSGESYRRWGDKDRGY